MDTTAPPADSGEEYPVYPDRSPAARRLFWTPNGPLEDAIRVAPSRYYDAGDVLEPYFRPGSPSADAPSSSSSSSWHPVSQESLLEPPISSITVRVYHIDEWEQMWSDQHWKCHRLTDAEAEAEGLYPHRVGPRPGDETLDASEYILECCGEKRPWSYGVELKVEAAGDFVTVHEYVSAVHPWLMGMRHRLLDVLGKMEGQPPWPPETKLAVLYFGRAQVRVDREERWVSWHRRPPAARSAAAGSSEEERGRRVMARLMTQSATMIRERAEEAARAGLSEQGGV